MILNVCFFTPNFHENVQYSIENMFCQKEIARSNPGEAGAFLIRMSNPSPEIIWGPTKPCNDVQCKYER